MKQTKSTTIKLNKGEMSVYDFGSAKLHAYKTNDFIDDEVFVIEKNGNAVVIESPCFYDNIKELEEYIAENKMKVAGVLVSYHAAGATFLKGAKKYATKHADAYGHTGGGKVLIDNFTNAFGEIFDSSIHDTTDFLGAGENVIGGIKFIIEDKEEGFDIEIPEINCVYTHMLGHDCHSIIAGSTHADAIIAELNGYIKKGYNFVLTSHYTPEDLKDVETKIAYLENLKKIAKTCKNKAEFEAKVEKEYPNYSGKNYLQMTSGFFFEK